MPRRQFRLRIRRGGLRYTIGKSQESEAAMSILSPTKPVRVEEFEQIEGNARLDLIEAELRPMPPMPGEEH